MLTDLEIGEKNGVRVRSDSEILHDSAMGILDLASLFRKQLDDLKEEICQSKGLLRVFVHPFFEEYSTKERFQNASPTAKATEISNLILRLIENDSKNKPPILILEDYRYEEETRKRLLSHIPKGQKLYILKTYHEMGIPRFTQEYLDEEKEWPKLYTVLDEVGVKRVLIGGMNLGVNVGVTNGNYALNRQMQEKGAINDEWSVGQCVGRVAGRLSQKYDVEISCFAYPDNRNSFHEIIGRNTSVPKK